MTQARYLLFNKKITAFLLVTSCILMSFYITDAAAKRNMLSTQSADGPTVVITIKDAFYGDADGDGKFDDVIAYIQHDFSGATRYNLDVYPTLILPSGTSFTWNYMINTRLSSVTVVAYFYNHALESGNYTLSIDAFLMTGGISHAEDSHIFDPPGGRGDNPPDFQVSTA